MSARVFAVVVAHNGARALADTLASLRRQTRPVPVIVVDTASTDDSVAVARAGGVDYLVRTGEDTPFGAAVDAAVTAVLPDLAADDWLWLLHDDSSPEPDALAELVAEQERSPSALVLGPKLVVAGQPETIDEFGLTMTPRGERISPAAGELDQAQFDTQSDVLAVGTAGMLVQGGLWRRLGGLDRSLAFSDDGLDFGVRARLAGARVVTVPRARVRHGRLSERGTAQQARTRRPSYRDVRWAQLYRRLGYATRGQAMLLWLLLPLLALGRSVAHLFEKRPGLIGGEWAATLSILGDAGLVRAHRRAIRDTTIAPWSTLEPLLVSAGSVSRLRAGQREEALFSEPDQEVEDPAPFWTTKAPLVALALWGLDALLWWRLIAVGAVSGGEARPLPDDWWAAIGDLFAGHRIGALDATLATDPTAMVWTLLSTLTFWHPSSIVVILMLTALPLAFMAGWHALRTLTGSARVRTVGGLLWALQPVLLQALAEGAVDTVLLHLTLPLAVGGLLGVLDGHAGRQRRLGRAAATGLWLAVVSACSPVAWLLAVVVALVMAVWRAPVRRTLWAMLLPSVALWVAPVRDAAVTGDWAGLLVVGDGLRQRGADDVLQAVLPGVTGDLWRTLVPALADRPTLTTLLALGSGALLVVLALLGLLTARWRRALVGVGVFAAATVAALAVLAVPVASRATGGLALDVTGLVDLGALGLVVAASATSGAVHGGRVLSAVLVVAVGTVGAVPGAVALLGHGAVAPVDAAAPALVTAEERAEPGARVLDIVVNADGSLDATVVPARLYGTMQARHRQVDAARTRDVGREATETVVANLVSFSGYEPDEALADLGVRFVLLRGADSTVDVQDTVSVLDANAALEPAGTSDAGRLWRTDRTASAEAAGGVWWAPALGLVALLFFGLLALPIARDRDGEGASAALTLLDGDDRS